MTRHWISFSHALLGLQLLTSSVAGAQRLPLPPRQQDAPSGSQVVAAVWSLPRQEREDRFYQEVVSGNIPDFMRELVAVEVLTSIGGIPRSLMYYVAPDYLAVGSDDDYFLAPMTPILAQRIADHLQCTLPTRRMVNQIYTAAPCKLAPSPIPPSPEMTTVPVFALHDSIVGAQRSADGSPLGTLVGGTKKDVVISTLIYQNLKPSVPRPVVIYGWHQLNGIPIQPLYNGHGETYADYSHGIRLVQEQCVLDSVPARVSDLMADAVLWSLVSDEGPIAAPRYTVPTSADDQRDPSHPGESFLLPNYPNPFNPLTTISVQLETASHVRLLVVGLGGETLSVLTDGVLDPGIHRYAWDASGMPSGVYFCRMESLTTSGRVSVGRTRRMLLLR